MMQVEFAGQFRRLIDTFGERAFPEERNKLIWKQICDMDIGWFAQLVDKMIGDLRQAPMLADFRDAAIREKKRRFDQETLQAASKWESGDVYGLKKYLTSIGAVSVSDAMDMARANIRNGGNGLPEDIT